MMLYRALRFAAFKHRHQFRSSSGPTDLRLPYIDHVLDVADRVSRISAMPADAEIIAVLHDTLEDTDTTYGELVREFGEYIADGVRALSLPKGDPNMDHPEKKTLFQIEQVCSPESNSIYAAVKIADKTSNVASLLSDPPKWGIKAQRGYVDNATRVVQAAVQHYPHAAHISDLAYIYDKVSHQVLSELELGAR